MLGVTFKKERGTTKSLGMRRGHRNSSSGTGEPAVLKGWGHSMGMHPGVATAPHTGRNWTTVVVTLDKIRGCPLWQALWTYTLGAVSLNPRNRPVSDRVRYEQSCCTPQALLTSLNLILLPQSILHLLTHAYWVSAVCHLLVWVLGTHLWTKETDPCSHGTNLSREVRRKRSYNIYASRG